MWSIYQLYGQLLNKHLRGSGMLLVFDWASVRKISNNDDYIAAYSGLILGLRPGNERRRYFVTPSLIGWAQT